MDLLALPFLVLAVAPVLSVLRMYPLYLDPYRALLLLVPRELLSKRVRKSGLRQGKQAAMMAVQISTVVLERKKNMGLEKRAPQGSGGREEGTSVPDGEIGTVPQEVAVFTIVGDEGNLNNGRNRSAGRKEW